MPHIIAHPLASGQRHHRANWLARILAVLERHGRPKALLDLDSTPDHLLRDIGLLDGRGAPLRRPERDYDPR
jgi:hypothetical protein